MISLALITITALLGGRTVACKPPGAAPALAVSVSQRTLTSATTNTYVLDDRIEIVKGSAHNVMDASVLCYERASVESDIPIAESGYAPFVTPGTKTFIFRTDNGRYSIQVNYTSNTVTYSTNFDCFAYGTLGSNMNAGLAVYYSGKSDTNTQWKLYGSDRIHRSNSCWASGLPLSCVLMKNGTSQTCTLITSRHGMSCAHVGDFASGSVIVAQGEDSLLYTNTVESKATAYHDLSLVTFFTNWHSSVVPASVFPMTYSNYFGYKEYAAGIFNNTHFLWIRNNTLCANAQLCDVLYGPTKQIAGVPFWSPQATAGDSGSAFFSVLGTNLVFIWAVGGVTVGGDFVSNPLYMPWIQANIGTNTLRLVDLSGYPTY